MKRPKQPTCETCPYAYFVGTSKNDQDSECRRFAPRMLGIYQPASARMYMPEINRHLRMYMPEINRHFWCGEHPDFPAYVEALKEFKKAMLTDHERI